MYFNGKNNTNIDDEFDNDNILSRLLLFFSKYKKIIIISIVVIILLILMLLLFTNRKVSSYLILNGEEIITIYQGDDYIEPGYIAYNSRDEDLNNQVFIETDLNKNAVGEYEILYKLGDITKIRYIKVVDKPEDYTFIYLNSVNNTVDVYLQKDNEYIEPGYQVYSTVGTNLTSKVKVSGEVDTSKKGIYKLTYSVVDLSGVTISVSRKVIVMDSDISLSLGSDEYTNQEVTINAYIIDEYFDYMLLPDNTKVSTNNYAYKVSENGKYTFKVYNKKGSSKEASIEVKNIDRVVPSGSCSGSFSDGISTVNIGASDNIGIDRYVISGKSYTSKNITINSEFKSVNVTIYDKAGNTKDISCDLEDKNFSVNLDDISSGYPSKKLDEFPNISVNYYNDFTYWVYHPVKHTDNLPMVVFIGGLGHVGNDYQKGKKTAIRGGPIDQVIKNGVEYDAIVVTLQVPYKNSEDTVYKYTHKYISLLNKLVDKFNADKDKISIMGYSHGCFGVMTIVDQYPKYFSAVVPVGCTWNQKYISSKSFINQPVWAISSTFDGNYEGHVSLKSFVNKVNEKGGNAKYTHINKHHDDLFRDAYSVVSDPELDIINWMISQSK